MASSFPRFGNAGPPSAGTRARRWRASRARWPRRVPRREPRATPRVARSARAPRAFRTALAAGGATATALLAVDQARAERARRRGRPGRPGRPGRRRGRGGALEGCRVLRPGPHRHRHQQQQALDREGGQVAGRVTPKLIFTAIYWFARYAMGRGEGAVCAAPRPRWRLPASPRAAAETEVEAVFDAALAHAHRPGCGPTMARHRDKRRAGSSRRRPSWQYAAPPPRRSSAWRRTRKSRLDAAVMEEDARGVLTGRAATVAARGRRQVPRD